jgi:post-segregation antitoxin (ccd killing protein)
MTIKFIMTKSRNITMPDEIWQYINDSNLNLSRFVQDRLKERIIAEGKANQYLKNIQKK